MFSILRYIFEVNGHQKSLIFYLSLSSGETRMQVQVKHTYRCRCNTDASAAKKINCLIKNVYWFNHI